MSDSDFQVTWTIQDTASTTPEAAAHEALRTLHDTFAGDQDAPALFQVVDRKADQVHQIDLGDPEGPGNSVTTVWPRPEGTRFQTRLGPADARYLVDDHGFLTLLVRVDQEAYFAGHAMFASGSGGDDHFDLLHHSALSFGMPYGPSADIVAVDQDCFLVEYTTDLSEFLNTPGDEP